MTPTRLRDFRPTMLGDDDDTPADSYERRAMAVIARRTRKLIAIALLFCVAAFATSAGTLLYMVHLQPRRERAERERADTLETVRQIRAALHVP